MNQELEAYRRPYRRGDYHLVDTTRRGTFWQSPEGIVVQMASAESARATVRGLAPSPTVLKSASAWSHALTILAGHPARQ